MPISARRSKPRRKPPAARKLPRVKFSTRAHWNAPVNQLTRERAWRGELLDLTETNPTRAGLDYPLDELADAMQRAARAPYDPQPLGLRSAREAVAASLQCDADDVVLTASTSEAYSFLFKLLADPGDDVLIAIPSYPLFEHLAALELITLRTFPLELHRRWELGPIAPGPRTRAIIVVNPNNPTGSFITPDEQHALAMHGIPLIADEVFLDYPLDARGTTLVRDDLLTFTLGGLSKSAGLPHYKLGWIRVSGPATERRAAIDALELIADNFLSVATPVQAALPELLRIAPRIRAEIAERTRANLAALHEIFASVAAARVLPVEGGWSAVLRVPRVMSDDEFALALLDRGVVVQPGYFFDFTTEGFIVVSLLVRPEIFAEGVRRIAAMIPA
ncbi:MAG: pyridoxal phosphate-dependent aminotransferase [Acidobacteria bacterium]|nr:pyridoxal phosphate-dependent aminotransferase [Acidobacteriota bacterium]MBV9477781.1 pyridoxal phosphate-dependent aminotransferase [Acidobacteriota bacterium]